MKPFKFQQFTVQQHPEVFRVGTDAVLLGALTSLKKVTQILEVGPGTGIVSLMLAQRAPKSFVSAVEINPVAATLCAENFAASPFGLRMHCQQEDVVSYAASCREKFDLVVCNPPYFAPNASTKDVVARQTVSLDAQRLIASAKCVLQPEGMLAVIIPFAQAALYREEALLGGFFLQRQINLLPRADQAPKRCILELVAHRQVCRIEQFVIEKNPREFSDQYLEATADFHVFRKK